MSWRDAVSLAVRGLGRRPGRAALTVLSIALATTLFSALVTIARTAQARVLDELADGGPLAGIRVVPAAADPGQIDEDDPDPGEPRPLDDGAVAQIRALEEVRHVVPVVGAQALVLLTEDIPGVDPDLPVPGSEASSVARGAVSASLVGVDLHRVGLLPITVEEGRLPASGTTTEIAVTKALLARLGIEEHDVTSILGTELVLGTPRLFIERDGPGARTRLRGRWLRAEVVGVVAQEAADGNVLASRDLVTAARRWTASSDASAGRFAEDLASPYSGLFVVADGLERVPEARAAIADVGFSSSAPENLIATVQRYLHVVEIVLAGIGLIALVIAALGVCSALLAAVRERRREIGVLKAIGARDRDVMRLFLLEAGAMGAVGGVAGTAAGVLVALLVGRVVNGYLVSEGLAAVSLAVPPAVVAGGIGGATLLALVAGAAPARRAARLPAREAVEA